ncbi:MAG: PoNe immunity protein domain-containing protein [Anaerolineales bacterium]
MLDNHIIIKRETFKEQAYFDEQVMYNDDMLLKFKETIANNNTTPEHRRRLRHTVFRRQVEQLILRYSQGETVSVIRDDFPAIVSALSAYQAEPGYSPHNFAEFDAYIYGIWLVSLAILLDVEDKIFNDLLAELGNRGRDALYERLVALRISGGPQISTLMYPKPYQFLFDALDSTGDEQASLIMQFLKTYYKGMKKAYWHDSHLGKDAGFFGYWCFELAAFVKKLKIDDHTFVENIFYPVDLVKYESQKD